MNRTKGFTLIELLVVIAIIGILSSVVLASLNTARGKGADAAIKSNLANARAQAELFYDTNTNSYDAGGAATDVCSSTADVSGVKGIYPSVLAAAGGTGLTTVVTVDGTAGALGQATCHSEATAWAAEAPLKATAGSVYCVDSTGVAKVTTTPLGSSDTSCN
jgi:prepilin-type N-terminal cleavage/methylation domain-containing protein